MNYDQRCWKLKYTNTCTWMFIPTLLIITTTRKQPWCPLIGEWINTIVAHPEMEYYSVMKRNEVSSHEKTCKYLKCIVLSERFQSEKTTYCTIPTIWLSGKGKTMKTLKSSGVARGWESRGDKD